ncbi:hypothetical protein BGZ95_007768 [Linnemannia exigua]|uniref:Uncharacterized protein n=1 Tax=Linnemannia exigua TaxID=604196 RepID=A0AAD4DF47_9FUNG|nr:hypothetical protein BGZ95_007768 [Linnemannia exigua]
MADVNTKVLNAVMEGSTLDDAFYVDYSTARTVEDLRGAIHRSISSLTSFRHRSLRDIDLERFQLWKVILPPGPGLISHQELRQEVIRLDNLNAVKIKLKLTDILDNIFNEVDSAKISFLTYVVVKVVD